MFATILCLHMHASFHDKTGLHLYSHILEYLETYSTLHDNKQNVFFFMVFPCSKVVVMCLKLYTEIH